MKRIGFLVLVGVQILLGGCATTPIIPSSNDYQLACQNLTTIGCPIGQDAACASTLEMEVVQRLTNIDVMCLKTATTPVAAVACGGVSCQ